LVFHCNASGTVRATYGVARQTVLKGRIAAQSQKLHRSQQEVPVGLELFNHLPWCSVLAVLAYGKEDPVPTQPIGNKVHSYAYKQPGRPRGGIDFPLAPEQSKTRHAEVPESKGVIRDRIQVILSDIPKRDGNRLSFQDVVDYRDSLKVEWDRGVGEELKALGVNMSVKFRLMHDSSTGGVTASSDHPDKARIDAYFAASQDRANEFRKIIQLGKLVSVAGNKLAPQEMQQTLQTEAMAWWYQANMDTTSLFTGGGVVFGMGNSTYKGLDIRV